MTDDFFLMRPWCSRQPYQNMSRPLTDYYINTSHNTYAFFFFPITTHSHLSLGIYSIVKCRVIAILKHTIEHYVLVVVLWKLIVMMVIMDNRSWHINSLWLNRVYLKRSFDLLNPICSKHHRRRIFRVRGNYSILLFRYPVILSIENHCSEGQRKEMARILRRVLGGKYRLIEFFKISFFSDRLITGPIIAKNSSVLPSPEDLKYKVLVRVSLWWIFHI